MLRLGCNTALRHGTRNTLRQNVRNSLIVLDYPSEGPASSFSQQRIGFAAHATNSVNADATSTTGASALPSIQDMQWDTQQDGVLMSFKNEVDEIISLCKQQTPDSALKAEELLRSIIEYIENNRDDVGDYTLISDRPKNMHFELVISSLVKNNNVQRAWNLNEYMDNLFQGRRYDARPVLTCFQAILSEFVRSGDAKRAEMTLDRMFELWNAKVIEVEPEKMTVSFNNVINAYARDGNAKKANDILKFMGQLYDCGVHPDSVSFNTVLKAYAQRGGQDAPQRASELLKFMEECFERGDPRVKPSRVSYNTVMDCWIKYGSSKKAVKQSEDLFDRMWTMSKNGNRDARPDSFTYNTLMNAFARLGGELAAVKTEDLLRQMEEMYQGGDTTMKPDTVTFNTVIKAWTNVGDWQSAENAEAILMLMEELYLGGEAKSAPDRVSYNSVIHAWSNCGKMEAAERADNVLRRMELFYDANGSKSNAQPDTVTYNTVMNAWVRSKSNETYEKVAALFNKMVIESEQGRMKLKPDRISYNMMIHALTQSKTDISNIRQAQELLLKSEQNFTSTKQSLGIGTYGAIIYACSKTKEDGVAQIADDVLWRMDRVCTFDKSSGLPYLSNYNMTIQTWMNSQEVEAVAKARKILDRMIEIHREEYRQFVPDSYSFNAVIYTAARAQGKDKTTALRTAMQTFDDLKQFEGGLVKPNHYTYHALLQCATNLVTEDTGSEKRDVMISNVFKLCCEEGYLDGLVLAHLRTKAHHLCRSLLRIKGKMPRFLDVKKDLPKEWSRNVSGGKKTRRRR